MGHISVGGPLVQELQDRVSTKETRIPLRYSAEHSRFFFFFFLRGFCSSEIEQQFPECVPWGFSRCYGVRELTESQLRLGSSKPNQMEWLLHCRSLRALSPLRGRDSPGGGGGRWRHR